MSTVESFDADKLTPSADAGPAVRPAPRGIMRRLVRRPLGMTALVVLLVIVVCCAAAPIIAPDGPQASDFTAVLQGPTWHHLLGTDELGRDVLSRILYGGRSTLLAAAMATAIAVAIGTVLGVIAGYLRGIADRAISVWAEVLLTMPLLVVLIVVVSVFPTSLYPAMIPLGLMLSAPVTRVIRAVTLSVREDLYIEAARVNGLTHVQVMYRHVVPRIRGPIVVQATLVASVAVVITTSIAFLGFGVQVPAPSWGSIVAEAASEYQRQVWFLVPAGGVIALTVLSLGLLGDALRDVVAEQWTGVPSPSRRARRVAVKARRAAAAPPKLTNAEVGRVPAEGGVAGAPRDTSTTDPGVLLEVRGLSVTAVAMDGGDLELVHDLSLELRAGKTLAIVGESGCGKSVTARALLGMVPTGGHMTGSVRFEGKQLVGASSATIRAVRGREIGFIGQDPIVSLDPTQTVGAGLVELIREYGDSDRASAKQQALKLLARVQLSDPQRVFSLYPHQISGGMAQRVVIARALSGAPKVLIADEPTTALDVTVQADILALLRSLQLSDGISVLLITHDWGVVAGLADDVLVMYAGQSVEDAAADDVFSRPSHPYTDGLLGCDPHRGAAGEKLPAIAGTVPSPSEWSTGCRFANRCGLCTQECREQAIPLALAAEGHDSRCIHIDQLLATQR